MFLKLILDHTGLEYVNKDYNMHNVHMNVYCRGLTGLFSRAKVNTW